MRIRFILTSALLIFTISPNYSIQAQTLPETTINKMPVLQSPLCDKGEASDIRFYPSGETWIETGCSENKIHGTFAMYYQTGQIYEEGKYQLGERQGEFLSYYDNGKVFRRTYYENDKINGVAVNYSKDGGILNQTEYVHGKVKTENFDKNVLNPGHEKFEGVFNNFEEAVLYKQNLSNGE